MEHPARTLQQRLQPLVVEAREVPGIGDHRRGLHRVQEIDQREDGLRPGAAALEEGHHGIDRDALHGLVTDVAQQFLEGQRRRGGAHEATHEIELVGDDAHPVADQGFAEVDAEELCGVQQVAGIVVGQQQRALAGLHAGVDELETGATLARARIAGNDVGTAGDESPDLAIERGQPAPD